MIKRAVSGEKIAKKSWLILLIITVFFANNALFCTISYGFSQSIDLYQKVYPCTVELLVNGRFSASGAFVSADGLIITAAHAMVDVNQKMEILSPVVHRAKVSLVALDRGHDLALLKVEKTSDKSLKYPYLKIAKKLPVPGKRIFIVASPFGKHGLMLSGAMAVNSCKYEYLNESKGYVQILYMSAMTPKGTSGGAWVNRQGQLVGVQSGWLDEKVIGPKTGLTNSGVEFMGPAWAVDKLLKTQKNACNASLGAIMEEFWTQAQGFQRRFPAGIEGIVIHRVRAGGPLDKAGIKHEDLITAVDGKAFVYRHKLLDFIRNKRPGDKVTVDYIRPDNKGMGEKEVVLDCLERLGQKQGKAAPRTAKGVKKAGKVQ